MQALIDVATRSQSGLAITENDLMSLSNALGIPSVPAANDQGKLNDFVRHAEDLAAESNAEDLARLKEIDQMDDRWLALTLPITQQILGCSTPQLVHACSTACSRCVRFGLVVSGWTCIANLEFMGRACRTSSAPD